MFDNSLNTSCFADSILKLFLGQGYRKPIKNIQNKKISFSNLFNSFFLQKEIILIFYPANNFLRIGDTPLLVSILADALNFLITRNKTYCGRLQKELFNFKNHAKMRQTFSIVNCVSDKWKGKID